MHNVCICMIVHECTYIHCSSCTYCCSTRKERSWWNLPWRKPIAYHNFISQVANVEHLNLARLTHPDGPGTRPGGTMPGTTGAIPGIIIGGAIPGNIIPPIWSIRGFLGAGSSSMRPDEGNERDRNIMNINM